MMCMYMKAISASSVVTASPARKSLMHASLCILAVKSTVCALAAPVMSFVVNAWHGWCRALCLEQRRGSSLCGKHW